MYQFTLKDFLTEEQFNLCNEHTQNTHLKSLRDNMEYVIADDKLYEISVYHYPKTHIITIRAPKTGFYNIQLVEQPLINPLKRIVSDIFCYENEEDLCNNYYNTKYNIQQDPFTKEKSILWERVDSTRIKAEYKTLNAHPKYCRNNDLAFKLFIEKNNTLLSLEYGNSISDFSTAISAKNIKGIHFLFEDDSTITFKPDKQKSTFKGNKFGQWILELSADIIDIFSTKLIKSIRLTSATESYDLLHIQKYETIILRHHFKKYKEALLECEIQLVNLPKVIEDGTNKTDERCFVYLMHDEANGFYKIGISNNPEYREHTLQSEKPTIVLVTAKEFPIRPIAEAFEAALHKTYETKRLRGEWFNLTVDDIEVLKKTLS